MTLNFINLGSRVKNVRNRRGISQMSLAEKIDKSATYISYIECGYKSMSLETFVAIANALNVSLKVSSGNVIEAGQIVVMPFAS